MIVGNGTSDTAAARPSVLRSAFLTYGANLTGALLSLINVLIVAGALGATGRGSVAFLTAISWFVAHLATLGVQEANANLAAARPGLRPSLATNSVFLALLLGVSSLAALALVVAAFPAVRGEADPTLFWATLAFVPVLILYPFMRFLVEADYKFTVTNVGYLFPPLLNVVVNGTLALFGVLSVETAVATWLAGQVLSTAFLAWYVARRLGGFGRPDPALARRSLSFGLRAHGGRAMLLGNYRLDQWLLGAIAGPRELGLYSVAVAWAEALWYLPTTLASVQRPDLVRARLDEAAGLASRIFRAAALITALAALVLIAAAPLLTVGLFGEEFRGSTDDLRVLAVGALGVVAVKLFGSALVAQGRPTLQSVGIGAGFAMTIVLDIVLIPPYGGLGAALASTLAYLSAGVVMGGIFLHVLRARPADLVPRVGDVVWFVRAFRDRVRRVPAPAQAESRTPIP